MDDKKLLGKVGAEVKFESTDIAKEPYDLILEYLLENGHADTIDEANYIMLKLDSQSIQTIVEMGNPSFDIRGGDARKAAKTQKINKAADAGVPNAAGKAKGPILPGGLRGV